MHTRLILCKISIKHLLITYFFRKRWCMHRYYRIFVFITLAPKCKTHHFHLLLLFVCLFVVFLTHFMPSWNRMSPSCIYNFLCSHLRNNGYRCSTVHELCHSTLYNYTHCKSAPYLSNIFTSHCNGYLGNKSFMCNCYTLIINFFNLSMYLWHRMSQLQRTITVRYIINVYMLACKVCVIFVQF